VASADFETGKVLSAPVIIPKPHLGLNDYPQWSPDGKYLAYLTKESSNSRNTQLSALVIRSMETGKVRELRPDLAYLYSPAAKDRPLWAPDGSLLVTGFDKKGLQGIYRIDAQNGDATPLVIAEPKTTLAAQAVSPDGKTLYIKKTIQSQDGVILARDIQSGREREMLRRSSFGDAVLSADGKLLATIGFDHATKSDSLLVIPAEGGAPRELLRVSNTESLGNFVAWTPDSRSLLFRKFPSGSTRREPWRISVEGGAPRQIDLNGALGPNPSIHPDGHQFAFVMGEPKLEIWALENFLPKN
jgi:Tol biopolymer transport system component